MHPVLSRQRGTRRLGFRTRSSVLFPKIFMLDTGIATALLGQGAFIDGSGLSKMATVGIEGIWYFGNAPANKVTTGGPEAPGTAYATSRYRRSASLMTSLVDV